MKKMKCSRFLGKSLYTPPYCVPHSATRQDRAAKIVQSACSPQHVPKACTPQLTHLQMYTHGFEYSDLNNYVVK
jgi:hypothetical protein